MHSLKKAASTAKGRVEPVLLPRGFVSKHLVTKQEQRGVPVEQQCTQVVFKRRIVIFTFRAMRQSTPSSTLNHTMASGGGVSLSYGSSGPTRTNTHSKGLKWNQLK